MKKKRNIGSLLLLLSHCRHATKCYDSCIVVVVVVLVKINRKYFLKHIFWTRNLQRHIFIVLSDVRVSYEYQVRQVSVSGLTGTRPEKVWFEIWEHLWTRQIFLGLAFDFDPRWIAHFGFQLAYYKDTAPDGITNRLWYCLWTRMTQAWPQNNCWQLSSDGLERLIRLLDLW